MMAAANIRRMSGLRMADQLGATLPLFLDLGAPKPSTRDVANAVKQGGTAALTEADRRADEARYQEVACRSALNAVNGMPFNWTLNPYRGCTHGCHYCFARRYHVQFEMNADDEFASVILVKRNVVEVLRRELDRPAWKRESRGRRHGDRSLSADRGSLPSHTRLSRPRWQPDGRRSAWSRRDR